MSSNIESNQNLSKVQDLIKKHDFDAVFCSLGTNFRYLFNSKANITERLILSIILPNILVSMEESTRCPSTSIS